MRIGDFPIVQRIMAARDELARKRDDGLLVVMIDAQKQDEELTEKVRSIVHAVLTERILELNADLKNLGVEV